MKKKFVAPGDPILTQAAREIPEDQVNSPQTKQVINQMLNIAYGKQKDKKKPVMVGLAAPQIGIFKRIILVDVKADSKGLPATPRKLGFRGGRGKVGDLRIYINPEIIWTSKRKGEWYEGCFSTGRICGIVSRPISIKIRAFVPQLGRLQAKLVTEKYKGYTARIFQHEIDHLDGKVFINHIKNPDHLHWVEEKEFPLYRDQEAWRNWPKKHRLT